MFVFLETIDMTTPTAKLYPDARVGATEAGPDLRNLLRARHGMISRRAKGRRAARAAVAHTMAPTQRTGGQF